MKFVQAPMLYLIWLVPLAAALFWHGRRRRQRLLKRFAKPPGLAAILPRHLPRRRVRAGLVLGTLLLLSVALAGPQYGYRWQEVERRGVDLIIALDCSRSMLAEDVKPTRLDRAKREIVDLLGMLAGDRVGLVAFAGTAFLQCPLTVDYEGFHLFLQHLGPEFLPVGGTDLAAALTVAAAGFDPETATDKAIILITDGGHTGTSALQPAIEAVKKAKIKVFGIGVGGEDGVPVPAAQGGFKKDRSGKIVLSRLDEAGLKQLALTTGGGYARSVAADMDLEAIYLAQIRKEMTARTLTASRRQIWEDRYQWALALALILLAVEMVLPSARQRKTAGHLVIVAMLAGALALPRPAWAADGREAAAAYASGDYGAALKGFIDAQLADPDNPEVLYNVGNAYYKNGEFSTAGQHYQDALDKLGDGIQDAELAAKLHYNLGNARFRDGQYSQAVESYAKALELAPDDVQAKENLAFAKQVMAQPPLPAQDQAGKPDQQQDEEERDGQQEGRQSPSSDETSQDASAGNKDPSEDAAGERQRQQQGQSDGGEEENPEADARSEFGKEMDAPPETALNQAQADPQAGEAENQTGAAAAQPGTQDIDPQMAEQMLNRLEDKPGRALIPTYAGPKVEQDW